MNNNKSIQTKYEERSFILECIEMYKSLPALWDVKSKDYNNRQIKNEAYSILLRKYRQRYPDATREDLTKKFNSLRTNFRKELKRLNYAERNCTDAAIESNLWYFKEMSFLLGQEITDNSQNNTFKEEEENVDDFSSVDLDDFPKEKNNIKQKRYTEEDVTVTRRKYFRLNENEYENIVRVWVMELQKMDPEQQIFAKKAINDIIYEGQLGTLNRDSVQINPSARHSASVDY